MSSLLEHTEIAHKIVWSAAIEALRAGGSKLARWEIQSLLYEGDDVKQTTELSLTLDIFGIYTYESSKILLSSTGLVGFSYQSISTGAHMSVEDDRRWYDGEAYEAIRELVNLALEVGRQQALKPAF